MGLNHEKKWVSKILWHTSFKNGQGWEFAHLIIHSFRTVSDSLRSLKTNEQPWANRSGHSRQMSDREQIPQVTQDKWATVSDSLRLLMINERMRASLKNFGLKKSKILFFSVFYISFFNLKNERFAHSLFFGERCEQFAQVANQKWVTMSELLRSLTKNECTSESLVF